MCTRTLREEGFKTGRDWDSFLKMEFDWVFKDEFLHLVEVQKALGPEETSLRKVLEPLK